MLVQQDSLTHLNGREVLIHVLGHRRKDTITDQKNTVLTCHKLDSLDTNKHAAHIARVGQP